MGNPNFNSSIQSENAELKKIDEKVLQESGNDLPKTCTPRRLNLPNAFNNGIEVQQIQWCRLLHEVFWQETGKLAVLSSHLVLIIP
ncbi:hypothetical protein Gotri_015682, partial [Gossypium trilobum]|nr:hypothetical protein [Gossypium trilobum]